MSGSPHHPSDNLSPREQSLDSFRPAVAQLAPQVRQEELEWALGRLHERIDRTSGTIRRTPIHSSRGDISLFRRGAIGTVLLGVAAYVGWNTTRRQAAGDEQRYATRAGEWATLSLRNGTHIQLGPATILTITSKSERGATLARLDGSALFSVTHAAQYTFTVRTSRATIRVLGTRFVVRQYATEPATQVSVRDGRVALEDTRRNTPYVLDAGALGVVSDTASIQVRRVGSSYSDTSWADGTLVFRGVPASDVTAELSRTYDADIRFSDPKLARRPLTWTIRTTQASLSQVLDILSLMLDARVTQSGHTFMIQPGRPAAAVPRFSPRELHSPSSYGR